MVSVITFTLLAWTVALQAGQVIPSQNVKIVIFTPETHADAVRQAMASAGAGRFSTTYDSASFSAKGIGRWRALPGANPAVGKIGEVESAPEERIEAICPAALVGDVLKSVRKVHPYEVIGYDLYPLLEYQE